MNSSKVLERFSSIRILPINLKQGDLDLFKDELEKHFAEVEIYELKHMSIWENSVFLDKNNIPGKVKYNSSFYQPKSRFQVFKKLLLSILNLRMVLKFKPYIWFTDDWSQGYFHWVLDALPRLFVALQEYPNARIILPLKFKQQEYVLSSIHQLGGARVYFKYPKKHYWFYQLIFPTHLAPTGNYHDPTIRQMRTVILSNVSKKGKKRIFISRAKSNRRKILNEDELIPILEYFGFTLVHFEDLNWMQQVEWSKQAEIMVGPHGAGLTNMLFMEPKTKLLELRRENDKHNNCYFSLASALQIDYYYQLCKTDSTDTLNCNFIVDKHAFKRNLKLMING